MRWLLLLFVLVQLLFPISANAHMSGQPSFFLINDVYTDFYPVMITSLPTTILPQDIAPQNYVIGSNLSFRIDSDILPFPQEVLDKTIFTWDFGDGDKATGLSQTHSYKKIGSYFLTISANYAGYSDTNTKPIIQAIFINIVPDAKYQLPKAIISINKRQIGDSSKDIITLTKNTVSFDASKSVEGSGKIVSYFWDKGDGTSTSDKQFLYSYTDNERLYLFPFLRVKDSNGFINDTYVQLDRSNAVSDQENEEKKINVILPILIVLGINIVIIGGLFLLLKKRKI